MPQFDRVLSMLEDRLKEASLAALEKCRRAEELIVVLTAAKHGSPEWLARFAELKTLVPPGIYLHHKSTEENPKLYTVLGVGDHSENGSFLVTCIAHYPPHKGNLCQKPLLGVGGFLQPVLKGRLTELDEDYSAARFEFDKELPQSFELFIELTTG